MKKKLFLSFFLFFFLSNTKLLSFNIVNRLASPFVDNYKYLENISETKKEKITDKENKAFLIFIIIIFVIGLLTPGRRYSRYGGYYYDNTYYSGSPYPRRNYSLLSETFYWFLTLLSKKGEERYREFNEDYIIKRDFEIKELLKKINFNYDELVKLTEYSFKQIILLFLSEKSDINQIATQSLYQKYLKEIASSYEKAIKYRINDLKIENIYLVNIRFTKLEKAFTSAVKYSAREYFVDAINGNFVSGDRFPIKRFIFMTFIYDENKFKLSLIENKGETYTLKLENIIEANETATLKHDDLKDISFSRIQLTVANCFFDVYSYWKDDTYNIKSKIDSKIIEKIKSTKEKLKNENTILKIDDFKIINIEILTLKKNAGFILTGFLARIKFIIKGSFIKNGISIISNEDKTTDEIWEFSIEEKNIILKEIVKKFENYSGSETTPLQIEWHI